MKKFMEEFKEFAMRGNVMDMAIGVIIASAFGNIIAAFTENIIGPIIGCLFQANLDEVVISVLDGKVTFGVGKLIAAILNFIIVAFVLFSLVKAVNKLKDLKKKEEEAVEEAPAKSDELVALEQIVELLKEKK